MITLLRKPNRKIWLLFLYSLLSWSMGTQKTYALFPQKINFSMVPARADFFIGRTKEIEALAPYFQKESDQLVVIPPITGADGLGKSQLVHELIAQHAAQYDHIVWINAATPEDIEASYLQIAKSWGIAPMPNKDPKEAIKKVVQLVKKRLASKHVLYIFYNAPNLNTIQGYFSSGHILITSENSAPADWASSYYDAPLALPPFSEKEAFAFAQKMGQDPKDPDLVKLVQLLPKYPLVLWQVFSTIAAGQYTPTSFLQKIGENGALVKQLIAKPEENTQTQYWLSYIMNVRDLHAVAQNTLTYSIESTLQPLQSTDNGPEILYLVQQMACLDAQPIPLHFVLRALGKEKEEAQIADMLLTLEKHGLIVQDAYNIYIHGAIQTAIRDLYPLTPEQVATLVERYVDYSIDNVVASKSYSPINFASEMRPHGEKLLAYVQKQRGEDIYTAKCYLGLSDLYRQQGNHQKALKFGEKALNLFIYIHGKDTSHTDIASAYNHLAQVYYHQAQYPKAFAFHQKALEMYKTVHGDIPHPYISATYGHLGNVCYKQGEYTQALEWYQYAFNICQKVYREGYLHPDIALSYYHLGNAHYSQGNHDKAIKAYEKAVDIYEDNTVYGNTPCTYIADSYNSLGRAYFAQGWYVQAATCHQKSIHMYRALYERISCLPIAFAYNNLGVAYHYQGKYAQALRLYQKALDILQSLYGDTPHRDIAIAYNNIGNVYRRQKLYTQSFAYHEKALAMYKEVAGDIPHDFMAAYYSHHGNLCYDQKQYEAAFGYYTRSFGIYSEVYGDNLHPDLANAYYNLGNGYYGQRKYEEALAYHQDALSMRKSLYGDLPHPHIALSYRMLGKVYFFQGKLRKAFACWGKSVAIKAKHQKESFLNKKIEIQHIPYPFII